MSAALNLAIAKIGASVTRTMASQRKEAARKVLTGRSGHLHGPMITPLTGFQASDPVPAAGIARLMARRDQLLRHASPHEAFQFRVALLCLRTRRRFEGRTKLPSNVVPFRRAA